jgi:flagellar motor switch/type III secretory pathway protein FliN
MMHATFSHTPASQAQNPTGTYQGALESTSFPQAPVIVSPASQRETIQNSAQALLSSWQPHTNLPQGNHHQVAHKKAFVAPPKVPKPQQALQQQCKHIMEATWRVLPTLESLLQQYWGMGIRLKPWIVTPTPDSIERMPPCYQSTIILDDTQQRQIHFSIPIELQHKLLTLALGEHLKVPSPSPSFTPSPLDNFLIDHCHESCFNALVEARFMDEWFPLALQPQMLHIGFLVLHHSEEASSGRSGTTTMENTLTSEPLEAELLGKWWIQAPLKAFTPHATGLHAGQTQYPILPLHTPHAWEPLVSTVSFTAGSTLSTLREMRQLASGDLLLLEKSQAPWLQMQQWVQPRNVGYFKQRMGHHFLPQHPVVKSQLRCVVPQLQQYPPHIAAMLKQTVRQDRQNFQRPSSSSLTQPSEAKFIPMMTPPSHPSSSHPAGLNNPQWDDLLIDVQASFDPIQMPLKQLKQVTQGLVLELGELRGKHIRLHVEGNTLAFGELVIIGEQFGVLIHDVVHQPPQGNTP